MAQKYKSVYFPEYPAKSPRKQSLTLAFGKETGEIYECVKGLSSAELRQLLGNDYQTLVSKAKADNLPLQKLGKRWFRSVDIFDESVAHCESHGIRDKGTVTSHQYLVLY
ncbi:hypothetical protein F4141_17820 [Candidatus Poribacteria bacterium]|nr:hypothetical protein [Candidatus Poribacteria bacterium]